MRNKLQLNKIRVFMGGLVIFSVACAMGGGSPTAIPAGRPANFEIQTITPTTAFTQVTAQPTPPKAEVAVVVPLGDAPTHTPDPNASPQPKPSPTDSPTPEAEIVTLTATTGVVTPTVAAATPVPRDVEPDPPLTGGDWDFEAEFVGWGNPHGEPCPGASVAQGWTAFVELGQYGSSCMNENLYAPNVFSGLKSQEITFDFIAANSGIYRTIPTKVGHQYNITAYAKHDRSLSPVEIYLGVDFDGGTEWSAETVTWFAWNDATEDTWAATETTVTATGPNITIFIRGFHPLAEQGGKTVIDNVSVTDLGL